MGKKRDKNSDNASQGQGLLNEAQQRKMGLRRLKQKSLI